MLFEGFKVFIFGEEFGEMLVTREGFKIHEDGVILGMAGIIDLQMGGVGEHRHDLLGDGLLVIAKINRVIQGFAHLGFAIRPRKPSAGFGGRKHDLWLNEGLTIGDIELMGDFLGLFDHRGLVFANRNDGRSKKKDVRGLGNRICKETNGDGFPEFAHA